MWRWAVWGFDPWDVWSLDIAVARFLSRRLPKFIKYRHGYPGGMSDEHWGEILGKINLAMNKIADFTWDDPADEMAVKEGLDLFREHFFSLWD
jgi:hypothetical protein